MIQKQYNILGMHKNLGNYLLENEGKCEIRKKPTINTINRGQIGGIANKLKKRAEKAKNKQKWQKLQKKTS